MDQILMSCDPNLAKIENAGTYTWTPQQVITCSNNPSSGKPVWSISIRPDDTKDEINFWPEFGVTDMEGNPTDGACDPIPSDQAMKLEIIPTYTSTVDQKIFSSWLLEDAVNKDGNPIPLATAPVDPLASTSTEPFAETITAAPLLPASSARGTANSPQADKTAIFLQVHTTGIAAGSSGNPTAQSAPTETGHGLPAGVKAAIALGVLILLSMMAFLAYLCWRLRSRKRQLFELGDTSTSNQHFFDSLRDNIVLGKAKAPDQKPPELSHGRLPLYGDVKRHEVRATRTPTIMSKRASVCQVELPGGWSPAEIDGRRKETNRRDSEGSETLRQSWEYFYSIMIKEWI